MTMPMMTMPMMMTMIIFRCGRHTASLTKSGWATSLQMNSGQMRIWDFNVKSMETFKIKKRILNSGWYFGPCLSDCQKLRLTKCSRLLTPMVMIIELWGGHHHLMVRYDKYLPGQEVGHLSMKSSEWCWEPQTIDHCSDHQEYHDIFSVGDDDGFWSNTSEKAEKVFSLL